MELYDRMTMRFILITIIVLLAGTCSCLGSEVVWDVEADYSVDPCDAKAGVDNAIAAALSHLASNPSDTVVLEFSADTYYFDHAGSAAISIIDSTNGSLILRGQGQEATTLVFGELGEQGIYISNSSNVTVEQMRLTRPHPGTTQGTVVSVSPGVVRFQLHAGFPDPLYLFPLGSNRERTLMGFRGDPLDPQMDPRSSKVKLDNMVSAGGDLYDAVLSNASEVPPWQSGDWIALKTKCGGQTIRMRACQDCIIQDVRITNAAGNPIRAVNANNRLIVRRVTIDRGDPINGKSACFSASGGGIQMYSAGEAATVQDCNVIATADDGIGIFSIDSNNLTSGALVENNIVRDNQARGILITQSVGGICRNNTLIRNDSSAIRIRANQDSEGFPNAAVKDWLISGNTIIQPWKEPAIKFDDEVTLCGLHNNIDIENNTIIEASKNNHVMYVDNANDIRFNNNTIVSFSDEDDYIRIATGDALVYVKNGLWIHGDGNKYQENTTRPLTAKNNPSDIVDVNFIYTGPVISSVDIVASEDSFINSNAPNSVYGSSGFMKIQNSSRQYQGLAKFELENVIGPNTLISATLKLTVHDAGFPLVDPQIYACTDNSWSEDDVNWVNRPAMGILLDEKSGTFHAVTTLEFDVTDYISADDTYSFYLRNATSDVGRYATKENTTYAGPTLEVVTANPDINADGDINFEDYAIIAKYWFTPCSAPLWCEGADLNISDMVDWDDVKMFTQNWDGLP